MGRSKNSQQIKRIKQILSWDFCQVRTPDSTAEWVLGIRVLGDWDIRVLGKDSLAIIAIIAIMVAMWERWNKNLYNYE